MGERDAVGHVTMVGDGERFSNDVSQRGGRKELRESEFSDGEHELGLKKGEFALQPAGAVGDFVGGGHAVAALGAFAGEAAADGGEIDAIANFVFGPAERLVEPFEKRFAGGPSERASEFGFLVAGRLTDEEDAGSHGATDDDGPDHGRAAGAAAEGGEVLFDGGERRAHGEKLQDPSTKIQRRTKT